MMDKLELLIDDINSVDREIKIMEVCGTHTMAICKNGINSILSDKIKLISGPGCPVCVTSAEDVDYLCDLARDSMNIIATYGDMLRVPGSLPENTLMKIKGQGAHVRMVYSSMDALEIARENKDKRVIFVGIGFETTLPATAAAIRDAHEEGIENFKVLSLHKKVEPVMRFLLEQKELEIEGFIIPGHVATIIGEDGFRFLEEYNSYGSITGFTGEEILYGVQRLLQNINNEEYGVYNAYKSVVSQRGNLLAIEDYNKIFVECDANWRGIGEIALSGMRINNRFKKFDIELIHERKTRNFENEKCRCGDVLMGKIKPDQCNLFNNGCTPINPVGPCMVSSEGSCAAYYKYRGTK